MVNCELLSGETTVSFVFIRKIRSENGGKDCVRIRPYLLAKKAARRDAAPQPGAVFCLPKTAPEQGQNIICGGFFL